MKKLKLKKSIRKKLLKVLITFIIMLIFLTILYVISNRVQFKILSNRDLIPVEIYENNYYTLSDFGYVRELSNNDYNNNNIDDSIDILNGLKSFAERNPKYISKYYAGGYPPETEGVCTDTIIEAIESAGYKLKDMISYDIYQTRYENEYGIDIIDSNIDYRRVGNQETFFKKYIDSYDTDYTNLKEFQPGDILVFDNGDHIAMVSDKISAKGVPYLIQNRDETQEEKEEDRLEITDMTITGHYRFIYNEKIKNLIIDMENA